MPRKFEDAFDHEMKPPLLWPWVLVIASAGTVLWMVLT